MNFPPTTYQTEAKDRLTVDRVEAILPLKDSTRQALPDDYQDATHIVLLQDRTEGLFLVLTNADIDGISKIQNWDYNDSERGE